MHDRASSTHPSTTRRALILLAALLTLLAACTGGGDAEGDADEGADPSTETQTDPDDDEADPEDDGDEEEGEADEVSGATAGTLTIPVASGSSLPEVDDALLQAAQRWIYEESGLSEMLQEELFLQSASTTRDVTHLTYVQEHGEVAVQGAVFIVHVNADAEVLGASQSLTSVLPGEDTEMLLDEQAAVDAAAKQVSGTLDGEPIVSATWLEVGTELRLGWEVQFATSGPTSNYIAVVDATTGAVLSLRETVINHAHDAVPPKAADREVAQSDAQCEAPAPPSACIFVVSPHFAAGSTLLGPDGANQALTGVPLTNLLDPADGQLIGTHAQIWQPEAARYADPDNVFGEGGRGGSDITFEAAMTYYWIDYTQQVVQSLGYRYHADDPVDFVPVDPEFRDNAAYLPFFDRIHMGDSSSGVNFAEDGDVVAHEYGHALLEDAVPNIQTEEGGAFHEGFADVVAAMTTIEFRNGDAACLGSWTSGGSCIRRLDTDLVHPDDLRFEVHLDAQIYTGAVWDVFEGRLAEEGLTPADCQQRPTPCDAARDEVFGTALGSLPFLTPQLSLQDAADAFAISDATFYEGANADLIAAAFAAHGLPVGDGDQVVVGTGGGAGAPMGDVVDSGEQTVIALTIDHSYRGDLQVIAGVVDPEGSLLCEPITLLTPDLSDGEDNVTGQIDVSDSPCAALAPPSAQQVWALLVVDTQAQDTGQLRDLSVIHEGIEYRAAGLPLTIPDDDPLGVVAFIGSDTAPPADSMTPGGSTPPPGQPAAEGTVTARIAVQHTYRGDLSVAMGVIDRDTDEILCAITVLEPDGTDGGDDLDLTVDASECVTWYPPGPNRTWVLRVLDNASQDVGTITAFDLTGPDGTTRSLAAPVPIPDNTGEAAFAIHE